MKLRLSAALPLFLIAVVATVVPNRAFAQDPPAGAIFDLSTVQTTAMNADAYTAFSTSFVADNASEYISFAFREVPSYFSFDNASVASSTAPSVNLLADPGFESDTAANVDTNFPVGWFRWIQPVDTSAIGVVASTTFAYGCDSGPASGTYFWCDGSVQGYDALYQLLNGLVVGDTYDITWDLTDDSGEAITYPTIDMLVYAGDELPVGSMPIGSTPGPAPEPSSLILLGTGLIGLIGAARGRFGRKPAVSS